MKLWRKFWADEVGANVALETVMVGSIGTLAVVGGVGAMANAVNDEFSEYAMAIRGLDQSYSVSGYSTDGTVQTGVNCFNGNNGNGGGAQSGTAGVAFSAYKSGSGFQQTSANVSVRSSRMSSIPAPVLNADVAGERPFLRTTGEITDDSDFAPRSAAPATPTNPRFVVVEEEVLRSDRTERSETAEQRAARLEREIERLRSENTQLRSRSVDPECPDNRPASDNPARLRSRQ